eukprot:TRINITY_DN1583_c0_g1_i4.p1 TRINITY_DN1583_c0_g1~~TRINITY_DN1583_c0_g1_i4.p1  ORF type:complete len:367 (-),score=71.62 TRINITY_DN1583_c0_g1_i4:15-1115(-)
MMYPRVPLLLCACVLSCVLGRVTPPAPGPYLPINGTNSWTLGANYPWNYYGGDFGTNSWGSMGVSTPKANATVTKQLSDIRSKGGRVIRWWLFSDGRAGITFDSSGTPTGLDAQVFKDLDAAITIARETNLYLCLSLFDFMFAYRASVVNGVQLGGHTAVIGNAQLYPPLLSNVLLPLFKRYANEPHILAWEVMNEPEWIISDLPQPSVNSQVDPVTMAQFWAFTKTIIDAVHDNTQQYVTVGSACLKWYRVYTSAFSQQKNLPVLELDFYQVHYYSWMNGGSENNDPDLGTVHFEPAKQPVGQLAGMKMPVVVGEFDASSNLSPLLDSFLGNGYAGAWPWSYNSNFQIDWTDYTNWAHAHASIIH